MSALFPRGGCPAFDLDQGVKVLFPQQSRSEAVKCNIGADLYVADFVTTRTDFLISQEHSSCIVLAGTNHQVRAVANMACLWAMVDTDDPPP